MIINAPSLKAAFDFADVDEDSDKVNEAVDLADTIAEKIINSQTYKEYQKALSKLKDDPEIMGRINQLKLKHLEYASERMRGAEDFNKEKYISQEFNKIMLNEDVKIYFKNEEKLVNIIADVYYKVAEKCQLNLFA